MKQKSLIGALVFIAILLGNCAAGRGDQFVFLPHVVGGRAILSATPSRTPRATVTTLATASPTSIATSTSTPTKFPLLTATPTTPPQPNVRWVDAYYVGYERNLLPINQVNFSTLTHLMVGRIAPLSDGTLNTTFDIDNINGPLFAKAAAQAAHAAGRKAILMLGGAGEHAGFVGATSNANRATFVQNILARMDEYGFDGIDMDWEPVEQADRAPLKALIHDLRTARPNMLLTMPVGIVNANFPGEVDVYYAEIAQDLDQISIMTYGMSGAYDGWTTWHFGPLFGEAASHPVSVDSSVQRYLSVGVPKAKLGIGMGFYGTCWKGVSQPGESLAGKNVTFTDNDMSYATIVSRYLPQATRHYDTTAKAPYLNSAGAFGPQNCTFVGYEDAESIAAKGAYVRTQGLGGGIIWTIAMGHVAGAPAGQRDALMDAVKVGFLD